MNPGKLATAMNDIDEDLIFDAISYRPEKKASKPARRLAALAACLVLAAAIFGAVQHAAGDYGLYIPDDQKETFYNTYKDLTPEAFEGEVRRQLEEAETGDYSEAPAGQTVTIEGTLEEKSEDQLFEQSALIIRGTVDEAIKMFQIQSVSGQTGNFTDYKITVQDVLRGSTDDEIVTVRVRGGTAGGVTEICSPVPELNAGEEYLLFLYQPGRGGTFNTRGDYYYVLGLPQGTFQRATTTAEPQASDIFISQTGYEISYSRILERADEYPVDPDYFRKEYLANQKLNLENGFITQSEYQKNIENIDTYASVVPNPLQ